MTSSEGPANQSPGLVPASWLQSCLFLSQDPQGTSWVGRVSLASEFGSQIISPLSAKEKANMPGTAVSEEGDKAR